MTRYRRVDITAFRRRVTITSGQHPVCRIPEEKVLLSDDESSDAIDILSDDGQKILIEAVRLLEENIKRMRPEIEPPNSPRFLMS